ncbi:MAG: Gfo/Idh/MocA family oxidoreductase [Planctomycetes bacterium]|nr:Gfo/Idh/MocA family oxidoreductase [Planctomycetota bacterium]
MAKRKLRAGIIGCGAIARSHMKAYQDNGVEITALFDVSPEAAQAMAKESGNQKVKCHATAAELIASGTVDMVSICTPPVAHEDAAIAAVKAGLHVLCEKPLAHSTASAKKIRNAAKKGKSVFMVAFRHRFIAANRKIKELIESGALGKLVMFRNVFGGPAFGMKDRWFTRREISGGGCLLDTNAHSVDLFRFLVGEVVEQHAVMHQHFENTDVEDVGLMVLKAKNGAVGSVGSGYVLGDGMAFIDITGQDGRVIFDYFKGSEIRWKKRGETEWRIETVEVGNGFNEQAVHFLSVIGGKEKLQITADDGLRCQEIIQSNYR